MIQELKDASSPLVQQFKNWPTQPQQQLLARQPRSWGLKTGLAQLQGPTRLETPQILQPAAPAASGTDQRARFSPLTWGPPTANYSLSSRLPASKSWFVRTVTVGWMWMLKVSKNTVLAQGKSQSIRDAGRTRVNAKRAVTGHSTGAFEKGYILVPHPHTLQTYSSAGKQDITARPP